MKIPKKKRKKSEKSKRYGRFKYPSKETVTDPEENPIILFKDKWFSYPIQNIRFYAGSEQFIFCLTSLEFRLMYFLILSMDFNYLVVTNLKFKEQFRNFLRSTSDMEATVKDSSVLNSLNKLRKLKLLIPLKTEPHQHMVNPLYFSKSYCERKVAIKFLKEMDMLPKDEKTKERYDKWSEFNGVEKTTEKKYFTLVPQEVTRKLNDRKPKSEIELWLEQV